MSEHCKNGHLRLQSNTYIWGGYRQCLTCKKVWNQKKLKRTPEKIATATRERFFSKVNKAGTCWLWTGQTVNEYGVFSVGKKKIMAHRWSYEHAKAPIAPGLWIDHLCRIKACVNPGHLEAVTPRENTLRGIGPNAVAHKSKQCRRGHLWPSDRQDGQRCKKCQVLKESRRKEVLQQKNDILKSLGTYVSRKGFSAHCVNGHFWDQENTYRDAKGWRRCRQCRRDRQSAKRLEEN